MPVWSYGVVFLGALVLALGLTPLALRFALRREVLDHPGGHKSHGAAVPYLGGLAMVGAFVVSLSTVAVLVPTSGGLIQLLVLLGLAFGLAVVGLCDDLWGLGVLPRLGAQVLAAGAIWTTGIGVQLAGVPALDLAITVLWVVGITNAFNLLDNMDGLSGGVAAIGASAFFVMAALNGQFLIAALSIALVGCALGFLRHNFHPARIYMGDAGSLFLGFVLAAVGIKLRFDAPLAVSMFVPVVALGVPILDTALVTTTRLLHGRSPLTGGRDHISHRLVFIGIPVPAAVGLVYAAAIGHGWMALVMSRLDQATGFLLMGLVLATDVFLGFLLANVPVYETNTQRRVALVEVARHEQPSPSPAVGPDMESSR